MTNPLITRLIEAVAAAERPGATKEQRKAANVAEAELQKVVDTLAADASRAAETATELERCKKRVESWRSISEKEIDDNDRLRRAAGAIVAGAFDTYRAKNGRQVSIEADDGEKCLIVHSDLIHDLNAVLKGEDDLGQRPAEATAPDDFARLFRVEGIGQVLAVLDGGEDEYGEDCECVTFRIPDAGDVARITYSIKAKGMSVERGKAFTREIFDKLTAESVAKVVEPMARAKASLLSEEGLVVQEGGAA